MLLPLTPLQINPINLTILCYTKKKPHTVYLASTSILFQFLRKCCKDGSISQVYYFYQTAKPHIPKIVAAVLIAFPKIGAPVLIAC